MLLKCLQRISEHLGRLRKSQRCRRPDRHAWNVDASAPKHVHSLIKSSMRVLCIGPCSAMGFTNCGAFANFIGKKAQAPDIQSEMRDVAQVMKTLRCWLPCEMEPSSGALESVGVKLMDVTGHGSTKYKDLLILSPRHPSTEFNFSQTLTLK